MAKKDKIRKPKAHTPRGFRDRRGDELIRERDMLARVSKVYEAHGFEPLDTPAFEFTDALGKFLPDVDRPNAGVFSLQDDDEQWMSLRYDLTAPLARFVAENYDALPKPYRRYQLGSVWRNEKPGPGRFRQFTQCDADTIGAPSPHADVESCILMAAAVEAAGVKPGEYIVRINDRNVLTGLLETLEIAGAEDAEKRLSVMRAMDKLDRLGDSGVRALLGKGRKDSSGDYTAGAGLRDDQIERVMAFMGAASETNAVTCDKLANLIGESEAGRKGVETLAAMAGQLAALGYKEDRIRIDLSVIRGLEYYTGPVFEAELTYDVKDTKGRPVQIGSIASGGRYDDLVKRFKGVEVPAVGVSLGVSRLLAALELSGAESAAPGPVVILAMDADQMARYQAMAEELRKSGLTAEVYLGGSGMRAQMKYADKRGAPVVIIEGEDERARGELTIKDLVLGAAMSKDIEGNTEWREGRPAQFSVERKDLVEAVKKVLAEQP
ncbi:MAG: histidine--tRNA ligase [Pseudomonadota bacterium]